jgi:hypothetical protein
VPRICASEHAASTRNFSPQSTARLRTDEKQGNGRALSLNRENQRKIIQKIAAKKGRFKCCHIYAKTQKQHSQNRQLSLLTRTVHLCCTISPKLDTI